MPGGFLGVDAFFVLSGYLITALLLAEWRSNDGWIDLVAFWGRRVRRLLPALLLMITVVALGARILLPPEEVRLLRGDGIAALFYVANWRLIFQGGDYFARTASPTPLEHTWSLAIEEQFYLVWPLVLVVLLGTRWLGRQSPERIGQGQEHRLIGLALVCGGGAVVSAVLLAATYSAEDPARAYYGTDSRGGSLLIGAGLASLLALRTRHVNGSPRSADVSMPLHRRVATGVLLAMAAGFTGYAWTHASGRDVVLYNGGMAAVAVAVAVVIAHVVLLPRGLAARLLALPPLPALGVISYGVYLWHWPVFIAANAERTGLVGSRLFALRCLLTLSLAVASYLLVERPIRMRLRPRRTVVVVTGVVAGTATALVTATALLVVSTSLPPVPDLPAVSALRTEAGPSGGDAVDGAEGIGAPVRQVAEPRLRRSPKTAPQPHPPMRTRRPGEPVVVDVFGDSVAWTLVSYLPRHPELDVRNRTQMGCGISRTAPYRYFGQLYAQLMPSCRSWPRTWRRVIEQDNPHVVLILVGRWETMDRVLAGRWTHVGEPEFDAHLRSELELSIAVAGSRGAHVLMATAPYNRRGEQPDGSLYPEDEAQRVTDWNALLRDVASGQPNVSVVDLGDRVSPEGKFSWTAGGVQVRSDGLHLTPSGVEQWIAPWLVPQLLEAAPQ
jgi:peptidoglycan/LPS O-acetylase OafA/YrhL